MTRRRWIIALALLAMVSMGLVTLLQMGIVKTLPDPPFSRFNSKKVNSSDSAYRYGTPDGTVDLLMLSIMVVLAAMGGLDRAATLPLVPLLGALLAVAAGIGAVSYFSEMRKTDVWCPYCIFTAAVHVAIVILILPEAWHAISNLIG